MTTLVYKGYSITSSLVERNIFLKLVDQLSFATYEATVDQIDLRTQYPLSAVYKVILQTFSDKDENFIVDISLLSGSLKLQFHALVGGFLDLHFEVVLREKIAVIDTLLLTMLEQQVTILKNQKSELEAKLDQVSRHNRHLEYANEQLEMLVHERNNPVCKLESGKRTLLDLFNGWGEEIDRTEQKLSKVEDNFFDQFNDQISTLPHTNSTIYTVREDGDCLSNPEIFFTKNTDGVKQINFNKVKYLYRWDKLIAHSYTGTPLVNDSLEDLELHGNFFTLDIQYLPALKKLSIHGATSLTNVVASLTAAKHQIKSLTFQGCTSVDVLELLTYCQTNKIELNIS